MYGSSLATGPVTYKPISLSSFTELTVHKPGPCIFLKGLHLFFSFHPKYKIYISKPHHKLISTRNYVLVSKIIFFGMNGKYIFLVKIDVNLLNFTIIHKDNRLVISKVFYGTQYDPMVVRSYYRFL
jgi:hypothetical protein